MNLKLAYPDRLIARLRSTALLIAISASSAAAQQVSVPDQYATIQSAINAVVNGSLPDGTTILVRPGIYAEALGVGNTARSFIVRGSGGAGVTILDAAGRGTAAITIFRATGNISFVGLTVRNGAPPVAAGGGFVVTQSSPSFVNCVFENNRASFGGGGTLITSHATFSGTVIRNNIAERSGGGVYIIDGSRPVFTASSIVNNRSGAGPPGVGNAGVGGGIDSRNASPTLRGTQVSGNSATFAGGGIYHGGQFGSPYGTATLMIEDSEIADNAVSAFSPSDGPAEGGGVHIEDNSTAQLTRTQVLRNRANTGGGLSAYRARYDLVDSAVEGNFATGRSDGGIGGGIVASSTNITEVRPSSIVNLTRTLVRGNTGITGGGVAATGDVDRPATLTLVDSVVDGNQSQNQGGGILLSWANLTASNSLITRNTVSGGGTPFGGGLLITTSSQARINGTTFAANTAGLYGGGIFMDGTAYLEMTGSRIVGNAANSGPGFGGGGLFVGPNGNNTGSVVSSIIADNTQYQIVENLCPKTRLTYTNNTLTPRPGANDLYFSPCEPGPGAVTSISGFNGLPNTSGNNSNVPRYAHVLAAPQFGTRFTLAWSFGRASSVTVAGVGTFSGGSGAVAVAPTSSTNYSISAVASPADGGNYAAVAVGVGYVAPPVGSPNRATASDFDGDGDADLAVFRPSTGAWFVSGMSGAPIFGGHGDIPVAADYDGDRKADIAVFRPSTGKWYGQRSGSGTLFEVLWGGTGDKPVQGDYDGDGKADIAVFRPTTGAWYIVRSSTGTSQAATFGGFGDQPVAADYDGDRRTDIAVFRPTTGVWYIIRSNTGTGVTVTFGGIGDRPVPADYDGDGKDDIALFRPSTGTWYISKSSGASSPALVFGGPGDTPVPGDFDGDGRADIAVFRPSTGMWYIAFAKGGGQASLFGGAGDIPILQR